MCRVLTSGRSRRDSRSNRVIGALTACVGCAPAPWSVVVFAVAPTGGIPSVSRVRKGKSVSIQMAKGDEIWATAKDETVWGPEKLGRQNEFIIDGDLMTWLESVDSAQDSSQRSRRKRTSGKKQKRDSKSRKQ